MELDFGSMESDVADIIRRNAIPEVAASQIVEYFLNGAIDDEEFEALPEEPCYPPTC